MLRLLMSILLTSSFALVGCQTSMVKQFNQVKSGMDKDDVLEIMGSPNRTERFHGKDRWTYVFYDNQIKHQKEVQFFEGSAVYIGDTWQPPEEKSAFAIDKRNEESEKAIQEQLAKEESVLQAARREFTTYESSVRSEDRVRYVPAFKGVD